MKRYDPLLAAARGVQRYWNADGLPEVLSGALMLLVPLVLYVRSLLPETSHWRTVLVVAFSTIAITAHVMSRHVLETIKRRLTYPRAGFVKFRALGIECHLAGLVLAVSLVLLFLALRAWSTQWTAWVLGLTGLAVGVFLAIGGVLLGLRRFYLLAALSLLLGMILALWTPAQLGQGFALYFGLMGAAQVASGLTALLGFLRAAPLPFQEAP